jgi:hypothetical protein
MVNRENENESLIEKQNHMNRRQFSLQWFRGSTTLQMLSSQILTIHDGPPLALKHSQTNNYTNRNYKTKLFVSLPPLLPSKDPFVLSE